jgi:AraC-like DNA-binding protein
VGRSVHPASSTDLAEESVLELMAAAIGIRPGPTSANLAAAKIFIDRRLGDQGLSAARVAAGIGLSDRQLSRIFAEQGTSVPQYILSRRLAVAHRLLSDAAQIGLPTSEVVRRCGLGSPSHFARAFKERYGLRPAELRSQTRASCVIDGSFPPSPADFGHVEASSFSTSR